jgi:hypothetical protein
MIEIVRLVRRQPTLSSKQSNTKIVLELNKLKSGTGRVAETHSLQGDSDKNSAGISEPEKDRGSRKGGSSVGSGGEQEKIPGSIANSHVVKHFGPLFEEYRRVKGEMKFALLGPAVHVPFGQAPVMKGNSKSTSITPSTRKALDITTGKLNFGDIELKSNNFANAIIDESHILPKPTSNIINKDSQVDQRSSASKSSIEASTTYKMKK